MRERIINIKMWGLSVNCPEPILSIGWLILTHVCVHHCIH